MFKDPSFLSLIDLVIGHAVPGHPPGKGLPIGSLTSQHFANFYLGELDHLLKDRLKVKSYLRYGVPFLGMRVYANLIRVQRSNLVRFRKRIKKLEYDYSAGRISEEDLVRSMSSRIAHLSHAQTLSLRKKEFQGSMDLA
jgi:hypothetical protein